MLPTSNEVSRRGVRSFHRMAERGSVVTNSDVTRDYRQEGRLVPQCSGGCQMIAATVRIGSTGKGRPAWKDLPRPARLAKAQTYIDP